MRIGLDIDNVISDMDRTVLPEFLALDKTKRNAGIVNPHAHVNHMFDWSPDEVEEFYVQNMERLAANLPIRRNCKKVMAQLLADGHELYLITNRQFPHYHQPQQTTITWLQKHGLPYTKLIFSASPDKTAECKKLKIDIMIDDRPDQCALMFKNGIRCYVMQTRYNIYDQHNLPTITSWKHLYNIISRGGDGWNRTSDTRGMNSVH